MKQCHLLSFYKNKGYIPQFENHRDYKLTSHSLSVSWGNESSISDISHVSPNQFGFTAHTNAIQTVRILMEKYKINKEDLRFAFIDLEKAFDLVPRKLV